MWGNTKRRSMIEAARSFRIRSGSPLTSAVTARSASRPAASMASIPVLDRSPAPPPSNSTSSASSARLACSEMIGDDADRVVTRQMRYARMLGAGILVGDRQRRDLHYRVHAGHLANVGLVPDGRHLPAEGTRSPD